MPKGEAGDNNAFFKTSRGVPLKTLLEAGDVTITATEDSERRHRQEPTPGILKKSPAIQADIAVTPLSKGGGLKAAGKGRPVARPQENGGRPIRRPAAKPARSVVGSESGLTNYEDDNTSIGGWRWTYEARYLDEETFHKIKSWSGVGVGGGGNGGGEDLCSLSSVLYEKMAYLL
jgi:hypothetical protein